MGFPVRGVIAMHIQTEVARQNFQEKFMYSVRLSLGNLEKNTDLDL